MGFIQENGGLINLLLGQTPNKKASKALAGLIPSLEMPGPTQDGSTNYGANSDAVKRAQLLRENYPVQALQGLLSSTSPEMKQKRDEDEMRKRLLGQQISNSEIQGKSNAMSLDRMESGYVSPADQSLIDYREAQIAGMGAGPSELDRLKLEEQQLKNQAARQAEITRRTASETAERESAGKALTGAFEADSALANIESLLDNDAYKDIYGTGDSYIPTIMPGSVTLEAKRDQVVSLLGLESRQKLKGQGTITDSESQQLAASATILGTSGISEGAAKSELARVRGIFERAKDRSLQNPEAFNRYHQETGMAALYEKVRNEEVPMKDLTAKQRVELGKYIRGMRNGFE